MRTTAGLGKGRFIPERESRCFCQSVQRIIALWVDRERWWRNFAKDRTTIPTVVGLGKDCVISLMKNGPRI